jgi:hypothetical protein
MIIIYKLKNGSTGYLFQCDASKSLDQIAQKDLPRNPDGSLPDYVTANDGVLPDLYFVDAVDIDGKRASINLEKAKEVQRNVWRNLRTQKLTSLDLESLKAIESGNAAKQSEVAAKKNALRDVTKLPLPNTPEEIKNYIPDILK